MNIIVAYDISLESEDGAKRLRRVAKVCKNFGKRVQKSVFECSIDAMKLEVLIHELERTMNKEEDSLKIYRMMEPREKAIITLGRNMELDFEKPLVL